MPLLALRTPVTLCRYRRCWVDVRWMSDIDIYLSGLLARRQNAWSQDGGNMRVIANGVNH